MWWYLVVSLANNLKLIDLYAGVRHKPNEKSDFFPFR